MSDEIDRANDIALQRLDDAIAEARHDIPPGVPGICEECEEPSPRLINGVCARCRDELKLP